MSNNNVIPAQFKPDVVLALLDEDEVVFNGVMVASEIVVFGSGCYSEAICVG
jgi:hypothetical protein